MDKENQNLQKQLEKIIADADPEHLHAGIDGEYEEEVKMFLSRINDSMNEEELLDVMHGVFQQMFNLPSDDVIREKYRPVVQEYLKIISG
ncbi:MAG: hypothetical protein A3C84_02710 [Candidatus Ryanbacteria bacterium RIFCSPHIGHO2_02_FULL_48_12]|uniref:Uncharacterized protein n=1 Tax=Candidatus Ryanbacteria bacterium RIFCSPHIGHO2_01_FULL_48_27 TaxID=1802115 RepID=A0A1G2G4P8_9BACT|nr:MAG: hypothetical protein A2756_01185 [Candidatus Ryanbacteria bacterium RIFCSPHIGHO2_01_FULL_48_27]OGZ49017.1 MAG: hypothetical protein A3C84_02710 [Candidatus Ryanbacteria bacterium RIFCSPHIGHO2_02_FULL_48_12]